MRKKIYIIFIVFSFCNQTLFYDFEFKVPSNQKCFEPSRRKKCQTLQGIKLIPKGCTGSVCKYKSMFFHRGLSSDNDYGYILHKDIWENENVIFLANKEKIIDKARSKEGIYGNYVDTIRGKTIDRVSGNLLFEFYSEGDFESRTLQFNNAPVVTITSLTLRTDKECECNEN